MTWKPLLLGGLAVLTLAPVSAIWSPRPAAALKTGRVGLNDPASTLVLLKANAVVGVTGHFDPQGTLTSLGVQCAFCHSTVDDSFAPGIGHRQDGWANRDLNVGAIVGLAPDLSAITTLLGVDEPTATLIPPAFGLAGVNLHIGIDDFQANRSPDKSYRTAPLRGLMTHAKGGFYHDGRFADLAAVVDHYNQFMKLALSDAEKRDLMEYLTSL